MSPRLKRAQRPDRELEEMRPADPDGGIVLRHRAVDTLSKMLRAGSITQEMCDAGREFQANFVLAGLDPIRARSLTLPCGGGCAPEITERRLDARRQVHEAIEALGGIDSPAASAVWHVLGCGCSVRQWVLRRSWARRPIRQEQGTGVLVAALGILSRCCGP